LGDAVIDLRDLVSTLLVAAGLAMTLAMVLHRVRASPRWRVSALALMVVGAEVAAGDLRLPPVEYLWVIVAILLLFPAHVIERAFGRVDLGSLLFHADFGMKGATLRDFAKDIRLGAQLSILLLLGVFLLWAVWRPADFVLVLVAFGFLAINPVVRDAIRYLVGRSPRGQLAARLVVPTLRPDPLETPDLMIVYLEGTDRRFADTALFGAAYEPLHALSRQGLTLERVCQITGTGWSVAGMVASQSGLPVVPRGAHIKRNTHRLASFMPTATFLGSVLAAKGYQNRYIVGAEIEFGGIGLMYRTHGFDRFTGKADMQEIWPEDVFRAASIGDYLDDQMVFDTALRQWAEAIEDPRPQATIVETIGPHGTTGYLSRGDTASGRAAPCRDTGTTVAALARRAVQFVAEVQAMNAARGRPLRVIVLSDHLCHTRMERGVDPALAGMNTVIFLGGPDRPRVIDRAGSMPDVFPTLLEWLGWADGPVAAGLGRSLLSDPMTLVEEFGKARLDRLVSHDVALGKAVWRDVEQE
jgi:phosphoglycerol transferase